MPTFHEEKPQRNMAIGELILQLIKERRGGDRNPNLLLQFAD
ncbi:hypothetical protein UUU_05590 [Klebsiella pneumoniae subsp. pneumoniae DSM 30104 = JCM 1662 = NBRC 14940]|nr:hypothetical protein UUU_05590 [Klebsiella pneumoniae subsp. pneumoniae DSM 30104 = JCM 1662 = NBRC 14940]